MNARRQRQLPGESPAAARAVAPKLSEHHENDDIYKHKFVKSRRRESKVDSAGTIGLRYRKSISGTGCER